MLRLALASESVLIALAVSIGWFVGINPFARIDPTLGALGIAVLATIPLILLAVSMDRAPGRGFSELKQFLDNVVSPLFSGCRWYDLAAISILAGLGEEIFFRGFIQDLLADYTSGPIALVVASIFFGVVHWVTPLYALLAGILGLYLGGLYIMTDNLLVPIVIHALYDFVLLMILVHQARQQTPPVFSEPYPWYSEDDDELVSAESSPSPVRTGFPPDHGPGGIGDAGDFLDQDRIAPRPDSAHLGESEPERERGPDGTGGL